MMGQHEGQKELFSYGVDLDRRVRAEHPLRRVQAMIDFTFARAAVAHTYGENGNVSVDPVVLLKLMFLLFHENVRSERELVRRLPERLDWLWFLGYSLDDEAPNHSVLSKARARWGGELFEELFVRTVRQCVEAGLVDGTKVHLDGSLIDADASRDSVVKADAETIARIRAAYGAQERKLDETKPPSARCETNLKLGTKKGDRCELWTTVNALTWWRACHGNCAWSMNASRTGGSGQCDALGGAGSEGTG
jgi:transposase